ncbi:hypothetical protein, partial [Leptospira interrogans]|uniref:hypothetical protein n=1 Tax=Leptospira interrogans TaxID=173 RepID=UPI001E54498D
FILNCLTASGLCKFDLRDTETFFFQSGSSHILSVCTLYETIWAKTNLLFILNCLTASGLCKFDLRDTETFFFQSGSSHISLNKILFFGKAVVPTFYLFARLVRNNLG